MSGILALRLSPLKPAVHIIQQDGAWWKKIQIRVFFFNVLRIRFVWMLESILEKKTWGKPNRNLWQLSLFPSCIQLLNSCQKSKALFVHFEQFWKAALTPVVFFYSLLISVKILKDLINNPHLYQAWSYYLNIKRHSNKCSCEMNHNH